MNIRSTCKSTVFSNNAHFYSFSLQRILISWSCEGDMNIKARAHWVEHIPVLLSTIHTLISILTLQHNILTNFSINRMNFIAINLNYWGGREIQSNQW